jgi:16S rRNA (uracil1498-N3)-methyltransferase
MHRCFIEPERWHSHQIEPSPEEARHLRHVLRAEVGDAVTVFDGAGLEARATVQNTPDGELLLVVEKTTEASPRPFDLVLIQAIPKGSHMDLIVEKATELGVARLIPIISDRVIVRLDSAQAKKRVERWERVVKSASKQCGTPWLPQIDAVQSFSSVLEQLSSFDAVLLGSLAEGVVPLREAVQTLKDTGLRSVAVIIGPEGDLTPAEADAALQAGARPVSFGGLTLRAETAALYALSVLSYEFLWR